jgi:hypothetical protein
MTEETMGLGVAFNGVVTALLNRDTILADFPRREELAAVKDQEFYPISLFLELCDYLENRLGMYAWLRVGRRMGVNIMNASFPPDIKTVEDAIAQIQVAHQMFLRPAVGAFDLTQRTPGQLVLRYTAPYSCTLQEGLFYEVAIRYGAANAAVNHVECRRKGAEACLFEIKY